MVGRGKIKCTQCGVEEWRALPEAICFNNICETCGGIMVPTGERETDNEWDATEEYKWNYRTTEPDRPDGL